MDIRKSEKHLPHRAMAELGHNLFASGGWGVARRLVVWRTRFFGARRAILTERYKSSGAVGKGQQQQQHVMSIAPGCGYVMDRTIRMAFFGAFLRSCD